MAGETMTALTMRLTQEDRNKTLLWLVENKELEGEEITLTVSKWNIGPIATIKAKVTEVIPLPLP